MIIKNGTIFTSEQTFEKLTVSTKDSLISEISDSAVTGDDTVIDATDCYVIPGLVDIHFHGCVGHDFCDGTKEAFQAIAEYELSQGVTSICPATMTLSQEELLSICTEAASFAKEQSDSTPAASLVGIHLEGPFLSMEKKGAQNPKYLRLSSVEEVKELQAAADGLVKLLSIAPELPGSLDTIKALKDSIVLSIAHTTADYDTACLALEAGASHVTHLYNAMNPFSHRAPGVIGAAADSENCDVELICDGIHIHPSMIRATFKLFTAEHVVLISDSMMATGMPDGDYSLGGQAVKMVNGNRATLADGTIAGSATNLFDCMKKAISFGIPVEDAVAAATINPARSIGLDKTIGSIEKGKTADLLILNKDLTIKHILHHGVLIK